MTTYPFDMQLVVDPFNTSNVVANGQIYIYDPNDTGNTSPLVLTDPNGLALTNPLMSNSNGFIPPFRANVPQVKWAGSGFVGYFDSYTGLRDEAVAAKGAAESALSLVQSPTDTQVDAGIERADIPGQVVAVVPGLVSAQVPPLVAPLVASALANDPAVANGAAALAQNAASLVPKWKASTAYTAGQQVITPEGDIASAIANFTSSASYNSANWNTSVARWVKPPLVTGADLNALTTPGLYPVNNFSIANSLTPVVPYVGSGSYVVLPSSTNLIHHWIPLDNPHQIWGRSKNGGTWSSWNLQSFSKNVLTAANDLNAVKVEGIYPAFVTNVPNNPSGTGGTLIVGPKIGINGSWTYCTQLWQTFEPNPRIFTRSTSTTAWNPWKEIGGAAEFAAAATQAAAPAVIQDMFRRRRGGVVGTGGKAAVCLRFDHGLNNFRSTILPLLRARNLPAALAINSGIFTTANSLAESNASSFAEIEGWTLNDGIEVWNHAETHRDATTSAGLKAELVDSLTTLRGSLPKSAIEGFILPGVGGTKYMGLNDIVTPDVFYTTEAGRMLLGGVNGAGGHAVVTGLLPGVIMPLDGQIKQGWSYRNMDTPSGVDAGISYVADAQASGGGVVLMMHPSLLDGTGNTSTAKLTEVLDFIAAERDAGRLEVLSHSGMEVASYDSSYRNNILRPITPGSSVSQGVDLTKYGHLLGATRKLVATVAVTAMASVTVSLTDATTGLNATRTYTGLTPGTHDLFQHGMIPLTATTATASAAVNSGTATIAALKLINV